MFRSDGIHHHFSPRFGRRFLVHFFLASNMLIHAPWYFKWNYCNITNTVPNWARVIAAMGFQWSSEWWMVRITGLWKNSLKWREHLLGLWINCTPPPRSLTTKHPIEIDRAPVGSRFFGLPTTMAFRGVQLAVPGYGGSKRPQEVSVGFFSPLQVELWAPFNEKLNGTLPTDP